MKNLEFKTNTEKVTARKNPNIVGVGDTIRPAGMRYQVEVTSVYPKGSQNMIKGTIISSKGSPLHRTSHTIEDVPTRNCHIIKKAE